VGSQLGQFETELMPSKSLLNAEIVTGTPSLWSPQESHLWGFCEDRRGSDS